MVVVIFDSASPVVGTDIFGADSVMKRYSKGKGAKKVMYMGILGGTVGTGKYTLMYGADKVACQLQSTHATLDMLNTQDLQNIVDKKWCDSNSEMTLVVDEAPGATITFIVGILEAGAYK